MGFVFSTSAMEATITAADNGTEVVGGNVGLGGPIIRNTEIAGLDNYYLMLGNIFAGEASLIVGNLTSLIGFANVILGISNFVSLSGTNNITESSLYLDENTSELGTRDVNSIEQAQFQTLFNNSQYIAETTATNANLINTNLLRVDQTEIYSETYDMAGNSYSFTLNAVGYQIDCNGNVFTITNLGQINSQPTSLLNFPDDAAAAIGGVDLNSFYHNNGALRIRLT
jgi:hypothetical protein